LAADICVCVRVYTCDGGRVLVRVHVCVRLCDGARVVVVAPEYRICMLIWLLVTSYYIYKICMCVHVCACVCI